MIRKGFICLLFICHLGIWSRGNSSFQRVSPLYEGVGTISRILKNIHVCEFRLGFLSYIYIYKMFIVYLFQNVTRAKQSSESST